MKPFLRAALLFLSASGLSQAAISAFYFAPGPNGSSLTATAQTGEAPDYIFTASSGTSIPAIIDARTSDPLLDFRVYLSAPDGGEVQPGVYTAYRGTNAPQGTVRFWWADEHLTPNPAAYIVDVLEIAYDSDGRITELAVDFTQYENPKNFLGDLSQYQSGFGSFRFNSDIPLGVPEPATTALVAVGMVFATRRSRRR